MCWSTRWQGILHDVPVSVRLHSASWQPLRSSASIRLVMQSDEAVVLLPVPLEDAGAWGKGGLTGLHFAHGVSPLSSWTLSMLIIVGSSYARLCGSESAAFMNKAQLCFVLSAARHSPRTQASGHTRSARDSLPARR